MLTIKGNGQIQIAIDHLIEPELETFDEVIKRYSALQIKLFYHVVSSPTCRYEKGFGKGRVSETISNMSATDRFKNILKTKCINGNPKSYFVNKHKESLTPSQIEAIKSVSFTFCDNENLKEHFKARKSCYCICFFHDFLEQSGIRPVVYLNNHDVIEQQQIIFNSPYLVETFGHTYDMRWENEWRIKNKLPFTKEDIAFLVVPDSEYANIIEWLWNSGEIDDDYIVLPSSIYTDPIKYLFMVPQLDHSGWGQIRLFDDGPKMDFDEFIEPTPDDREELIAVAGDYLSCLCKADIQELYEHKFTQRFFSFVGELDDTTKKLPIFNKYENIKKNAHEPWASSRELVISSYEALFHIQRDRITSKW